LINVSLWVTMTILEPPLADTVSTSIRASLA
jgi:hypothetical protein